MYVQTYFRFNMGRVPSSCSDFSSSSRFVCVAFFCLVDFCCFWGWGYVCAAVCNVLVVFILRDSQAPRKNNNNCMQRVRRQGKKNALIKFDADAPLSTKYGWVPNLLYCTRGGPVVGNQEAAHIFINYMYDIVLEISFLDINTGPNLSRSNLKLLQKSVKIQYIFQKFLCMADGPDRTDFWIQKNFLFLPFLIIFQIWWIKKMPRAKKNVNIKNSFYMPVNHAKEYLIFADTGVVFLQLLARASNGCR